MIIHLDKAGSLIRFKDCLASTLAEPTVQGVFILACEANQLPEDKLNELLRKVRVPVIGGIFPEIFHQQTRLDRGFIMLGLPQAPEVSLIPNVSNPKTNLRQHLHSHSLPKGAARTMIVLVDGQATRISSLMEALYCRFGLQTNFLGAGAGSQHSGLQGCLFSKEGMLSDHAILASLAIPSHIHVSPRTQKLQGPFPITLGDPNTIQLLSHKPAFEHYRHILAAATGQTVNRQNFSEIARFYPFGLNRSEGKRIVREPLLVRDDGAIVCRGGMEGEHFVDILSFSPQESSPLEAQTTLSHPTNIDSTCLLLTSVAHAQHMADAFTRMLRSQQQLHPSFIGALTLGEIGNQGGTHLEYHSHTTVTGLLDA
ncbi:MAG: FIST N-terminal domain-containing protein [Bacteroidota bacterium]